MKRVLFVRRFKTLRGGHLTMRDYFQHALAHPELDPYFYFTPDSKLYKTTLWADIPRERIVERWHPDEYDVVFIGSTGWEYLPDDLGDTEVIAMCLHVRHGKNPRLRKELTRPAYRIADAQQVHDTIAPLANGPVEVIHEGFDLTLFSSSVPKVPRSVMIYGQKNPKLANALAEALRADGAHVTAFNRGKSPEEFAAIMSRSLVYVGLPHQTEGFYRPPVEAMAAGTAVVCSDAVGSRVHLEPGVTCLQPGYDDFDGYLRDVRRLLDDDDLRMRLVANGAEVARSFSIEHQRELFHAFVDRHLFGPDSKPPRASAAEAATPMGPGEPTRPGESTGPARS